jgi:hypothetical protein
VVPTAILQENIYNPLRLLNAKPLNVNKIPTYNVEDKPSPTIWNPRFYKLLHPSVSPPIINSERRLLTESRIHA